MPCEIKPSNKEIDDHELTHIPFRSWCKQCVFGRAQSHPHYSKEKEKDVEKTGHPTISWDYCCMEADKTRREEHQVEAAEGIGEF